MPPAKAASGPLPAGQISPAILFAGGQRGIQCTGHRRHRRVQRQFSQRDIVGDLAGRNDAHRRQQPKRDRKIVMAAFLGQVGGREIDGDALEGQRQADGGQRRAHPLAAFRHRLVGQADNVELAAAGIPDMHLHVHFPASMPWKATV